MDCKEFRELLDLYVDGELAPESLAGAGVHARECAACRRAESEMQRLRDAVRGAVAKYEPPPGLVRDVRLMIQPPWRRLFAHIFGGARADTAGNRLPIWKRKVSIPAPVFTMLLVAIIATAMWAASARRDVKPARQEPGRQVIQAPQAAAQAPGGLNLEGLDRGERAAIYKVRLGDLGDGGR